MGLTLNINGTTSILSPIAQTTPKSMNDSAGLNVQQRLTNTTSANINHKPRFIRNPLVKAVPFLT